MGNIIPFLREKECSNLKISRQCRLALDEVCVALNLPVSDNQARQAIAERIIALAGRGECSPMKLRERVLNEAAVPI